MKKKGRNKGKMEESKEGRKGEKESGEGGRKKK